MTTASRRVSPRLRTLAAASIGLLAAAGLVACSDSDSPSETTTGAATDAESSAAEDAFPVTIEHAFGETVIDEVPERVATISWANQDAAIALGVVPVAMPFASYGGDADGYLPWTLSALEALGDERPTLFSDTDGIPFEDIAAAAPELILATYSGISQEEYDQLSRIAPTVAYPEIPWYTDWRDQLEIAGKALGKEAEAADRRTEIEAQLETAIAGAPEIQGKTFAYLWFDAADPSTVTYYTTADARVEFVESLGLVSAPKIEELSAENDAFFGTISAELADQIDADIVLAYVDDAAHLEAVEADPLLGAIPAIASGAVVPLDDATFILSTSAPSPLSVPWAIDQYVPLIQEAATQVP